MTSTFPTDLDALTNPSSNDPTNSPTVPHAEQHTTANDALEALEAKVGVDGSDDETSLDYLVKSANQPGHTHVGVSVLEFDGASKTVFHGQFWPVGPSLGVCLWEAWIRIDGDGGIYWISDGYGGGHAMLAGFSVRSPTGNVWINGALVTFGGDYTAAVGEWLHMSVEWSGTQIVTRINGVPVGMTAASGTRTSLEGTIYMGGSDHNNWDGAIAQVRGFEGHRPSSLTADEQVTVCERPLGPETIARSSGGRAQFLADYTGLTDRGLLVPDLSDGYRGLLHHGMLWKGNIPNSGGKSGRPLPRPVIDPTCPLNPHETVALTSAVPAAPATPAGAKIFDSFSRAEQLPTWLDSTIEQLSLGATEAGSLGPKVWQGSDIAWGIQQGRAIQTAFGGVKWVQNDSADMDVRIDRRVVNGLHGTGLAFRVQDASNFWYVNTIGPTSAPSGGDGQVRVGRKVAGVATDVGTPALPATNWTTLRATAAGTTITIYVDNGSGGWTQIAQYLSQTVFQAEVGAGVFCPNLDGPRLGFRRHDNFTVL